MSNPRVLDSALINVASDGYQQDLKQFMAKPYRLRTGAWTTTSPYQMCAIPLPQELLAINLYKNKVDGFLGFRATMVVKLQVNGNKFQQGRLIMSYVPQATIAGTFPYMRTGSLMKLTQLPNVQLDVACDTEAVLRIPYVSPTSHYNLLDGTGSSAGVFLHVYFPLKIGTGANNATYSVWVSFEDVELVTPTLDQTFFAQSGGKRNVSDRELIAHKSGPIESVFSGISTVATALVGVPFLSSIAGPASWVSAALAKTAATFGWSNPRDESSVIRIKRETYAYLNNCDNQSEALPLALKSSNKVDILPGFAGTDLDEASIAFIASRPAWFTSSSWNANQGESTQIWTGRLAPKDYAIQGTSGTAPILDIFDYTPIAFLANLFHYWRGSIRMTFKFAKTEFHSGRLVVAYGPGVKSASTPTLADTTFVHRSIIDLREGNEFTFIFPFVSTTPWKDTIDQDSYGRVWLKVLNPLVAPDTVSPDIAFSVEVSMDTDAQFAFPHCYKGKVAVLNQTAFVAQSGLPKYSYFPSHFNPGVFTPAPQIYQAQAGTVSDNASPCSVTPTNDTVGATHRSAVSIACEQYCIGENIASLNQLCRKASRIERAGTAGDGTTKSYIELRPFTIGGRGIYGANLKDISSFCGDWVSILSPLYAYNRGGVRYTIVPSVASTVDQIDAFLGVTLQSTTINISNSDVLSWDSPVTNQSSLHVSSRLPLDGSLTFDVPSYSRTQCRLNRITISDAIGAGAVEPNDIYSSQQCVVLDPKINDCKFSIRRQAADDFQLGFFLGIPTFVVGSH